MEVEAAEPASNRGAWSSWPTELPPETSTTSASSRASASLDALRAVGQDLEGQADAAVALHEGSQHHGIAVDDVGRQRAGYPRAAARRP